MTAMSQLMDAADLGWPKTPAELVQEQPGPTVSRETSAEPVGLGWPE